MSAVCLGLMAGTSLDGIDVAICQIDGHATAAVVTTLAFETVPYPAAVRDELLALYQSPTNAVARVCAMNVVVGRCFGDAARQVMDAAGITGEQVEVIGSHGQTVWHQPVVDPADPLLVSSTLQIGEASEIAARTGAPVMADFRVADIAVGGLGAPLAPYFDWALLSDPRTNRAIQNIGGIGNISWLPAGGSVDDVIAFDTGPGNMLIDALVRRLTEGALAYDDGGVIARAGHVDEATLAWLLADDYLAAPPPKTSGREYFGAAYVDRIVSRMGLSADTVATVTAFTAQSIAEACRRWLPQLPDELYVNGGGARNPVLMAMLQEACGGWPVCPTDALGIDADAKEAVLFALLAHDGLAGLPTNLPRVTGARRGVSLGKLTRL